GYGAHDVHAKSPLDEPIAERLSFGDSPVIGITRDQAHGHRFHRARQHGLPYGSPPPPGGPGGGAPPAAAAAGRRARRGARGGPAAGWAREVADQAETVTVSLPTPDIVLEVATRQDGIISGNRVRRFIDTSTTGAEMASRIFAALKAKNIVQIDSPVSGGVSGAEKGTLAVMVSGPRADVEAAEPALKVFGKVFFISERPGEIGRAHV